MIWSVVISTHFVLFLLQGRRDGWLLRVNPCCVAETKLRGRLCVRSIKEACKVAHSRIEDKSEKIEKTKKKFDWHTRVVYVYTNTSCRFSL